MKPVGVARCAPTPTIMTAKIAVNVPNPNAALIRVRIRQS
jgi:hypothetical protein